jgi:hypothetical protein
MAIRMVIYFYRILNETIRAPGLGTSYPNRHIGYRAARPPICGRSLALDKVRRNYIADESFAPVNP